MALRETLSTLVNHSGSGVARVRLAGGLTISLAKTIRLTMPGVLLAVQLSREKARPSLLEWRTVLSSLPAHVLVEKPREFTYDGRYYLSGKVRLESEPVEGG